jgi:hypothetical protein
MADAMTKLGQGDLTATVAVESNDELGALSEHFNQMTVGLQERYEMRRSLNLANGILLAASLKNWFFKLFCSYNLVSLLPGPNLRFFSARETGSIPAFHRALWATIST